MKGSIKSSSKLAIGQSPSVVRPTTVEVGRLITDLLAAHHALLTTVRSHREAMRNADVDQMAEALSAQQRCMEDIAALEARRTNLAKACEGAVSKRELMTLTDMVLYVEHTGDDAREQLLAKVAELRGVMSDVRREQSALGQAATQLAAHVDGLMRLVVQKLSSAGVYGRTGRVDVPRAALSVDMRS